MEKVRVALIGFGGIGKRYAQIFASGQIAGMDLIGICCYNKAGQDHIRMLYPDLHIFTTAEELYAAKNLYDAVIITTPHPSHVEIASQVALLRRHILLDQPAGTNTLEVRQLLSIVHAQRVKLGLIFNKRVYPVYQKLKELLNEDSIGQLTRILWIDNKRYQSAADLEAKDWLYSWKGAGGGLLINQCQHNLDLWQWLFGMPDVLYADIDYGKYHDHAVDDAVDLQFKYESGLHGNFIASSGEAPGLNRLEIWGTQGRICIEDEAKLTLWRADRDLQSFEQDRSAHPEPLVYTQEDLTLEAPNEEQSFVQVFQRFAAYLCHSKVTPVAIGNDALQALMLANGAYLSSWLKRELSYPMDDLLYSKMLQEQIETEVGL